MQPPMVRTKLKTTQSVHRDGIMGMLPKALGEAKGVEEEEEGL